MNKLVMRFKTATEGKYFTLTVDDIKEDDKGAATVTEQEINSKISQKLFLNYKKIYDIIISKISNKLTLLILTALEGAELR